MLATNVIAMVLILIGALNSGLIGFFNYNFLSVLFGGEATGDYSVVCRIVFGIIGLAGLWGVNFLKRSKAFSGPCPKKRK